MTIAESTAVVVVGAGIAGVACARVVSDAGLPVLLLDRGRRPGGRMASRTIEGRPVDLGASYFTVSDSDFLDVVSRWQRRELAHPWTDTFHVLHGNGDRERKPGPVRWGARRGLRALVEDLAAGLDVTRQRTVERVEVADGRLVVDGAPSPAVVLAMPDPQARRLLAGDLERHRQSLSVEYEPVLALTAVFDERSWDCDGAFLPDDPTLDWVADDGRRRGDGAPVLVAHSTADVAARHLDHPEGAVPELVAALRRVLGLPDPRHARVHRWSFARPRGEREQPFLLTDELLGACGDGWGGKPRVEGAYLSGLALGRRLVERLT